VAAAHEDHHSWTSFESWLEDANVIMLLSGLLTALLTTLFFLPCMANHLDPQGSTRPCLSQLYHLLARPNSTTITLPPLSATRAGPVTFSALTRALWLASFVVGLICTAVAALLKRWLCQYLLMTRTSHRPRGCMTIQALVYLKEFSQTLHALYLVSVLLFLWGLGVHLLRISNPPSLLVVVGSGAILFVGQCLIISAFPRDTRRGVEASVV